MHGIKPDPCIKLEHIHTHSTIRSVTSITDKNMDPAWNSIISFILVTISKYHQWALVIMIRVFIGPALGFKPSPFSMPIPCTYYDSQWRNPLIIVSAQKWTTSFSISKRPRYKCTLFHITYLYIGKYTLNGKIICQRKQIQQTEWIVTTYKYENYFKYFSSA